MQMHSGFLFIAHFRYCFSATENDQQSFKISNISFASFDIAYLSIFAVRRALLLNCSHNDRNLYNHISQPIFVNHKLKEFMNSITPFLRAKVYFRMPAQSPFVLVFHWVYNISKYYCFCSRRSSSNICATTF